MKAAAVLNVEIVVLTMAGSSARRRSIQWLTVVLAALVTDHIQLLTDSDILFS
jgi:hypothetical protein